MTVFASKDAFLGLGIEEIQPSATHIAQDCPICKKPLAVHHNDGSVKARLNGYHDAVRIISCGHMHGKVCLQAWADVGNTCPTCDRILFELTGDPITQRDINNLVHALGPEYGHARVNVALVGIMQKQEQEHAAMRRAHEQDIAQQKMKDTMEIEEGFLLSAEDLLDTDEELDLGLAVDKDEDEVGEYLKNNEDEEYEEDEKEKYDSTK